MEPHKLHEGLTDLFTKTENFTQSTTEIVVPSSQIDDRPHCTTMYKCTCISEEDPDISIRGIRFISEIFFFFFIKISKDTETLFKAKITKHGKKKNNNDEIGNILLKHVFTLKKWEPGPSDHPLDLPMQSHVLWTMKQVSTIF